MIQTENRHIFKVSELNRDVRALLESGFPLIWLQGEISNLARPASGHWYLSLKDAQAQVRCAMFRNKNRLLDFQPENGIEVLVRARVSLYEPRGEFQIIIEHMEEAGSGALQRAFDQLKAKLQAEGLFDSQHKIALPDFPKRIGVITSPSGAAIRDILTTLKRRSPNLPVVIYPVQVQGEGSAAQIAQAIAQADYRKDCDVLILARGGGSLEDLWSFNEEIVARAIYTCETPIVCGVGHEVDFTIADFVADQRAPTPTAAAELVSPDQQRMQAELQSYAQRLTQLSSRHILQHAQRLQWLQARLQHPSRRLQDQAQRLDELEARLQRAQHNLRREAAHRLEQRLEKLQRHSPQSRILHAQQRITELQQRLLGKQQQLQQGRQHKLTELLRTLDAVSPLATLARGYSIVFKEDGKEIVRHSTDVAPGERIQAQLSKGRLHCVIEKVTET